MTPHPTEPEQPTPSPADAASAAAPDGAEQRADPEPSDAGGPTQPDTAAADVTKLVAPPPDGPESTETRERYARPGSDRLDDEFLTMVGRRRTGATAAAFFDLDKTIIARSSTLVMGRTFLKDGLLSPTTVLRGLYAQVVYQLVGADHERMEQMRHAVLDLTKGWDADRVRMLVRETMEEIIAPLAYAEALDLIEEHQRQGRDVWIVSSSGEEIVEPFAAHLGIRDWIATRGGLDEHGCFDGTLTFYAYGAHKATAIRQVADVRGYDLTESYAYTDSITDLPMLSVVGHPVAVNADRELRAAATAMDWDVRDFHSPVSLRSRLPDVQRPRNEVLVGALGVLAAATFVWRFILRGED